MTLFPSTPMTSSKRSSQRRSIGKNMSFDPPGLSSKPSDNDLLGFSSLMPPPPDKPGFFSRLLRFPVAVITFPFRLIGRIFGGGSGA